MCAAIEKRDFGASQPAARKQSYISSYDELMSHCGPEASVRCLAAIRPEVKYQSCGLPGNAGRQHNLEHSPRANSSV